MTLPNLICTKCVEFPPISKHVLSRTGLEPATSAVTGRRANQLRYRGFLNIVKYSVYIDAETSLREIRTNDKTPRLDLNVGSKVVNHHRFKRENSHFVESERRRVLIVFQ